MYQYSKYVRGVLCMAITAKEFWMWMTLKGQIQGQSDFEALYLVKEQLRYVLLLNVNRKAYAWSPMVFA